MIVPFAVCAADEAELMAFANSVSGITAITDGTPGPTADEACQCLMQVMEFVRGAWTTKTDVAVYVLYMGVIYILFRVFLEPTEKTESIIGFRSSPPAKLQEVFMCEFEQWLNPQFSLLPLFQERSDIMLLLKAFRDCAGRQLLSQYLFVIEFFNKVFSDKDTLAAFIKPGSFIAMDMAKVVSSFLATNASNQRVPSETLVTRVFNFSCGFIDCLFAMFRKEEGQMIITQLFRDSHYDMYAASFMVLDLFGYLMKRGEVKSPMWNTLTNMITTRECLSAVVANFAQFMAVYIFPFVFQIDAEEAKEACLNHVRRVQRTRQVTPHDFIAENMELILTDPHKFAREMLKPYYADYEQYQWLCKNLRIRPFREGKPVDDDAVEMVVRFIDSFEFYPDIEDIESKRMAFMPIIGFCQAMSIFGSLLPGLAKNPYAAYSLCSRRLFRAVLAQNDPVIRKMAFDLVSDMINVTQMKEHVSEEDLTNWYASLIIMILNTDGKVREEAFRKAVKTVQIGFTGSSILLGFLMNVAESGIVPIGEAVVSLVSSFPMLVVESRLPESFAKNLNKMITKDKSSYVPNAIELVEKVGGSLRDRAIAMLKGWRATENWPLILPGYCALLADELAKDSPAADLVVFILETFLLPIDKQCFEVIVVIRSILMYSEKLQKLIPKEFTRLIECLSKKVCLLTGSADPQWAIELIKLMTDVYVECSKLVKWSQAYQDFTNFLVTASRSSSPFDDRVKKCITNMCDLLLMFYGTYPFHQTLYYPTVTHHFTQEKETTVATVGRTIIMPKHDGEWTTFSCQNSTGQSIWRFKEVDELLCDEQNVAPFSVPLSSKDEAIQDCKELASEKEFIDMFDSVVSHCEGYFSREFEIPESPEDHTAAFEAQLNEVQGLIEETREAQSSREHKVRPKIKCFNRATGALSACGRFTMRHPDQMSILNPGPHTTQLAKNLQLLNYRLGVKIGVVYVGEGCDNQNQILATTYDQTSKYFREFITGLGWSVDIPTHVGYDGGLDRKNQSNGKSSIFYADFMNEIMFHVAPLIPTDPKDEQQVYKKRHIGNDHIHVVWCASNHEYDTSTITSQFNQAHIVIYPLETGLFRVEIFWQKDLPWFGPLRWPVVVTKRALPSLIRATSMAAMNSFYSTRKEYMDPQITIVNGMDDVMSKKCPTSCQYDPVTKMMMIPE